MTKPLEGGDRPYLVVAAPDDQVSLESPTEWTTIDGPAIRRARTGSVRHSRIELTLAMLRADG